MAQSQARAAARKDAATEDPQHYKVESENDHARVLRCTYGPHERSKMHGHGPHVAIALTDARFRFTYPDGRTEERQFKAGDSILVDAVEHLPENIGDQPARVILVEIKG
jgi:quercetin dioxygenase-like cupin family protein